MTNNLTTLVLSEFLVLLPQLTELTVIYPLPGRVYRTEHGVVSGTIRTACPAMLEIVNACRILPDFDTLQIVHLFDISSLPLHALQSHTGGGRELDGWSERRRVFLEEVGVVKDTAVGVLEQTMREEREYGGKTRKITIRVIELKWGLEWNIESGMIGTHWPGRKYLRSVKAEEYEVY